MWIFTIFFFRSALVNLILDFSIDQARKSILYHKKKHRKSDRFVLQCWSQGVIDFQIFCQNEKQKWQIHPPMSISRRDWFPNFLSKRHKKSDRFVPQCWSQGVISKFSVKTTKKSYRFIHQCRFQGVIDFQEN